LQKFGSKDLWLSILITIEVRTSTSSTTDG
jgi:hypothetical protein